MARTDTFKRFEQGTLDPRNRKRAEAAEDSSRNDLRLKAADILERMTNQRSDRRQQEISDRAVRQARRRDVARSLSIPGFNTPPTGGVGSLPANPASSVGGGFALNYQGIPENAILPSGRINPVPGGTFSNTFGAPRDGGARRHQGTDIFADKGTPIISPINGTVGSMEPSLGGTSVRVIDDQGNSFFFTHMANFAPGLQPGQKVKPGSLLGFVGDTGNAKGTPPHLHFGINETRSNVINSYNWLMGQ